MSLLEIYIKTLVDGYLQESTELEPFSLDQLKRLSEPSQVLAFTEHSLDSQRLSQDKNRVVYLLNNSVLLKVARNVDGLSENQAEINSGENELTGFMFPSILGSDDQKFSWVATRQPEKMTPSRFKELTGLSWSEFLFVLGGAFPRTLGNKTRGQVAQHHHAFDKHYTNTFIRQVIKMTKECNLEPESLGRIDTWGISDNKPVVVKLVTRGKL